MHYRVLGKTGYSVSAIGLGAWQIGGDWGNVDDETAIRTLQAAVDAGVTFIDTADVYGDGRSERLIARFRRKTPSGLIVATKIGRRAPLDLAQYTSENLELWIDRSREYLEMDRLDLVQLHCLPTDTYYHPEIFASMDRLVARGKVTAYGVSVERVEEALKAMEYSGVSTVQIIFNIFRQRPAGLLFYEALRRNVGIIARVPLASGLLSGKFKPDTRFPADDHREFNRHGEHFDVGETFAGLDYETGLAAVEQLRPMIPPEITMAQCALRWVLMHPAVSTVIPGAKSPEQARANAEAADLAPLSPAFMQCAEEVYRTRAAPLVHHRW